MHLFLPKNVTPTNKYISQLCIKAYLLHEYASTSFCSIFCEKNLKVKSTTTFHFVSWMELKEEKSVFDILFLQTKLYWHWRHSFLGGLVFFIGIWFHFIAESLFALCVYDLSDLLLCCKVKCYNILFTIFHLKIEGRKRMMIMFTVLVPSKDQHVIFYNSNCSSRKVIGSFLINSQDVHNILLLLKSWRKKHQYFAVIEKLSCKNEIERLLF